MNMEDEMGEYRERIERRYGDRRHKNDRRHEAPEPAPKFADWPLILDLLVFVAMGFWMYFTN